MLKIREEGMWFEFEGAKFKVRPLISSKIRDLRDKCVRKEISYDRAGKRITNEIVDDEKFESLLADYLLESWEGVGDDSGNPFEVNSENKKKIFDVVALRDFIWNAAQSITREDSEKN